MRLIILVFCLFISGDSWSQQLLSIDSISNDLSHILDLNVLPKMDSLSRDDFFKWMALGVTENEELKQGDNWNIGIDNLYASGESLSYFGSGFYTNIFIENNRKIFGIPLKIGANLIVQENQLNTRMSKLYVDFDYEEYINELQEKARLELSVVAFGKLDVKEKALIWNAFVVEKNKQTTKIEEYKNSMDSLKTQNIEDQNALLSIREKIFKDVQKMQDKDNNTDYIDQKSEDAPKSDKSILSNIRKLNIGSFQATGSGFDVASIPLHGVNVELNKKGYYAAVILGKEGKQRQNLPDYVRNLRLFGEGRKVTCLKAGIGMPNKNHVHISFSHIQVAGTSMDTSNISTAKRNVVISLDSRYNMPNGLYTEIIGSLSNTDLSGTSKSMELLQGMYKGMANGDQNFAFVIRSGWKDKADKNTVNVSYQMVGYGFSTLGNLFLLKSRNTLRFETKHRLWQNKLQTKLSYIHGIGNSENNLYPQVRQNQLSGDLSVRLDKRGSRIWVSYSPNYYLQQSDGIVNATLYQLNLITVGSQIVHKKTKKGQWVTLLQTTNFSDQSQYGDTSTVSGFYYFMCMQSYTSNKYAFNVIYNIGLDQYNMKSIKDINIDLNQTLDLKRIQITQGIQTIKRYFDAAVLAGGSLGMHWKPSSKIRLGFIATYLFDVSVNRKNQLFANTTFGWQF